ncbi:MAG TPA: CBS domain-containing protein [Polyangium sp.]|nr:CBS domain-containing protein [Polyangium sp.]
MTHAPLHVSTLMKSPVLSVDPETHLDKVYQTLVLQRISSVPVLDAQGKALGVVSMTDLLRVGRLQPASLAGIQAIELPAEPAKEHMHSGVITIAADANVTRAAQLMAEHHVHRIYVEDQGRIAGVFSIEEVLAAARALHIARPIRDIMSRPVITLAVTATLADAASRLDRVGVTGVAILDDHGYPVGAFTQVEALAARDLPPSTRVEDVMNYGLVLQHVETPLYRAAAYAFEARARRVFAMDNGELVGVVTGLDFARALAASA